MVCVCVCVRIAFTVDLYFMQVILFCLCVCVLCILCFFFVITLANGKYKAYRLYSFSSPLRSTTWVSSMSEPLSELDKLESIDVTVLSTVALLLLLSLLRCKSICAISGSFSGGVSISASLVSSIWLTIKWPLLTSSMAFRSFKLTKILR